MLPSQRHSWTIWHTCTEPGDASAKVASSKSRSRWGHPAQPQEQRRLSISGADISDTAANVEGEATLRLLADPELYAEFQARIRQRRPATNVATHELLKEFLEEKKYFDRKMDQTTNTGSLSKTGSTDDESDNAEKPPKTVPGRLGSFLQKNQERQKSQITAGNGSLPSLEELSEKKRMQRRSTMDVVSMASSSSVSTHTTSATDNSSFEVSLSGLIQPTSWFSRKG